MWQNLAFKTLFLIFILTFLLVVFVGYDYEQERNFQAQNLATQVAEELRSSAHQLYATISATSTSITTVATQLSTGQLPRSQILPRLKQILKTSSHLSAIGVAFIPHLHSPEARRQSPYYISKSSQPSTDSLQLFLTPCFTGANETDLVRCVVFGEISRTSLGAWLANLKIGKIGYNLLFTPQGTVLAEPFNDQQPQTITNLTGISNFQKLTIEANQSGLREYPATKTTQSMWLFYQTIPFGDWVLGTLYNQNEFMAQSAQKLRHNLIWLSFWVIFWLGLLAALILRIDKGNISSWWQIVLAISSLLLIGMGFIWYLGLSVSVYEDSSKTVITNNADLNRLKASKFEVTKPVYVPTGALIESIEFTEDDSVIVTGYIWQKYAVTIPKDITRGLVLPKAMPSLKLTEVERHRENHTEVIKWYFEGIIQQKFAYTQYPLDRRAISFQIRHQDFAKNVILVPDLTINQPNAWLGLKPELEISNWNIIASFFNYQNSSITKSIGRTSPINLYFTVVVQRNLLNPFILNILPIIIVVSMLFIILLLMGRVGRFANIVAPLTALFLGTLIAHVGLRQKIPDLSVSYIEYFYLVMYLAMLGIVISYLIFNRKKEGFFTQFNNDFLFRIKQKRFYNQYRNGLVLKLLFLPLILATLWGITAWVFYYYP